MIKIQNESRNLIEVSVTGPLHAEDFREFGKQADALIKKHGNVRVLIDASGFDGWDDFDAAKHHFSFVKTHHEKVERLAVVAGYMWQHWLAGLAQVFIHPKIKVFDKGQIEDARTWLKQ